MRYTTFAYDFAFVQLAVSRPISDRPFFRHILQCRRTRHTSGVMSVCLVSPSTLETTSALLLYRWDDVQVHVSFKSKLLSLV